MKKLLFILFTSCLIQCQTFGDNELEKEWKSIKDASLKKGNEGRRLGQLLLYNKDVPESLLTKVLAWSNRLRISSEGENKLDNVNFHHLQISNDSLDAVMPDMFEWLSLEQDSLLQDQYNDYRKTFLNDARIVDSIKIRFNEVAGNEGSSYLFGVKKVREKASF